jgi:hypothetical protein
VLGCASRFGGGDVKAPCWSEVYVMADAQFTAFLSPIVAWVGGHVWHLLFIYWAVYVATLLSDISRSLKAIENSKVSQRNTERG